MSEQAADSAAWRRAEMRRLQQAGDSDGLLEFFRGLEQNANLTPEELVVRGRCILLGPEDNPYTLEDAERSYLQALEVDPTYIPAILELGFYYYTVEDDARKALPYFERVLALTRGHFTQAARGRSGCLVELVSREAGAEALRQANTSPLLLEELWPDELEMLEGGQEEAEATPLEPR